MPGRPAASALWTIFLLLACAPIGPPARAQVASPTGQPNGKPHAGETQDGSSSVSTRAPRLGPRQPIPVPQPPAVPVTTETGTLDGASFRIDVPQNWNRSLVVYFHGYEQRPRIFPPSTPAQPHPPGRVLQQVLDRGYAVAESGYSAGGWAVPNAMKNTAELLHYFRKKHGAPHETLVMGHSMGGLLTVMSLEQHPNDYAGGLALCGVLAPADLVMQRAFANRVAFDAFFPGILPDVEHIPDSFTMNDLPTIVAVQRALDAHPAEAALVRSLADIHTNRGLADVLVFNTFVIKDLRQKAGGNPFDNSNLIYTGTTDDYTLNDRVRRYAANPKSLRFLADYYSPTGVIKRKLLAVHTTYDPLVPAATAAYYDELTRRLGDDDLFVQQYVNRDGHCNITAEQTGEAFDELLAWVHQGKRPMPGKLPSPQQKQTAAPLQKQPSPKNVGKPQ